MVNKKYNYLLFLIVLIIIVTGSLFLIKKETNNYSLNESNINNVLFRDRVSKFAREVAESYFDKKIIQYPKELKVESNWGLSVTLYHNGKIKGQGLGKNKKLYLALEEATKSALNGFNKEDLKEAKFLIRFLSSSYNFSFIESNGQEKELIADIVPIRNLDKNLIIQKIKEGKEFLYKMENPVEHGFYKEYDVLNDKFENRLYTVYSSSIVYTFLYVYDLEKDSDILKNISDWGNFILSMQDKDKNGESFGAFHYSYYLDTKEKENRFVVGTSALSIFTLLRLYDLTGDLKYLDSAKLAGDWLTTMQKTNGSMNSYLLKDSNGLTKDSKESLLYNGQVLSALSKLYGVTKERKYYNTAKAIAEYFAEKYEQASGFVDDDYRKKDPISNSWIVMSLKDFYKVEFNESDKNKYKKIIFELSEKVLKNQENDPKDILNYGTWIGVNSSSGTGWIDEVMAEMYKFCKEENREDCDKYKDAVVKAIRWIIQNTYSADNSFFIEKPEKAIGGIFWSQNNKYVRNDSVCHALNGYVIIMSYLNDGVLLSIPEEITN